MSDARKVLFVDRDGTLVEEPADEQVDSLEKIRFMPDVFASLQKLTAAGYRLVMVTNQDGLGTSSFPREKFELAQNFIVDAFASQGLAFDAICVCPHRPADGCDCRKPRPGHVADYLRNTQVDLAHSAVIGPARAAQRQRRGNLAGHRARTAGTPRQLQARDQGDAHPDRTRPG